MHFTYAGYTIPRPKMCGTRLQVRVDCVQLWGGAGPGAGVSRLCSLVGRGGPGGGCEAVQLLGRLPLPPQQRLVPLRQPRVPGEHSAAQHHAPKRQVCIVHYSQDELRGEGLLRALQGDL